MMRFTGEGSEQKGWRPGVVFQNNTGNIHSPNIIALPLTSAIKKKNMPTHVFIRAVDSGLRIDSIALCENPERMSKNRIGEYITTLPDNYMTQIAKASLLASSVISFIDIKTLILCWKEAISLNSVTV